MGTKQETAENKTARMRELVDLLNRPAGPTTRKPGRS